MKDMFGNEVDAQAMWDAPMQPKKRKRIGLATEDGMILDLWCRFLEWLGFGEDDDDDDEKEYLDYD